MCHQNPSTSSPLASKFGSLKTLRQAIISRRVFNLHVSASAAVADEATEDIWNNLKTGLLKKNEEVCGTTRPHCWRRETWWWKEHIEKVIAAKQKAFKAWKAGKDARASYNAAKRNARHAVHHARQEADKKVYENIDHNTTLLTSLEERTLMLLVTNLWRMMQERCQWDKAEGLARALPKASQWWVWVGPRPPVLSATSGRPACPNHHW